MKNSLVLLLVLSVLGVLAQGSPKVPPPYVPTPTLSLAARPKPSTRPIVPGSHVAKGLPPQVGGLAK